MSSPRRRRGKKNRERERGGPKSNLLGQLGQVQVDTKAAKIIERAHTHTDYTRMSQELYLIIYIVIHKCNNKKKSSRGVLT